MKTRNLFSHALIAAIALMLGTVVAPYASAQCGYLPGPKLGFNFQPLSRQAPSKAAPGKLTLVSDDRSDDGDRIVGFWKVLFVAEGNPIGGPPDGVTIDFGFQQWHSDGTEILNSGMRAPATGNFCLGVWKRVGRSKYKLNHFAISSDPGGNLIGPANVLEEVVLDHDGDSFSGTFTIQQFDTHGNVLGGVKGTATGTRIKVDTQP